MNTSPSPQLAPEVEALHGLIESAKNGAIELWKSVGAALNAANASVITERNPDNIPATRVESGTETDTASRFEVKYG